MAVGENSEVLSSGASPVSNQLDGSGEVSRSVKLEGNSGLATLNRGGWGTGTCLITRDVGVRVMRPVPTQTEGGAEDVGADRMP